MPRFTYDPSVSSLAARAAISSRLHGISGSFRSRTGRVLLDPLVGRLLGGQRDDPLHEDPGRVHVVGVELAGLAEVLDLGDGDLAAHRGQRVEVARGVAVDEVAVTVALPGPDQPEVGDDRLLEHVLAPLAVPVLERARLLRR